MNNFIYHNPTKLVFGKGQIDRLGNLLPAAKTAAAACAPTGCTLSS